MLKFLQYAAFNLLLAFLCSFALYVISPAGSGSGIPDVKAFLNGAVVLASVWDSNRA
jgi:chloride channel 7